MSECKECKGPVSTALWSTRSRGFCSSGCHIVYLEKVIDDKEENLAFEFKQDNDALQIYIKELEDKLDKIAKIMHYPDCWDTACYTNLESAIYETFGCNDDECEVKG